MVVARQGPPLLIGVGVVGFALLAGIPVGVFSALFPRLGHVLMRMIDVLMSFPALLLALGLIVRIAVWWAKGGMHYPDEVFQYLEPANLHLTGLAWLPWEFDRGVRSWILPTFYGGISWWGR